MFALKQSTILLVLAFCILATSSTQGAGLPLPGVWGLSSRPCTAQGLLQEWHDVDNLGDDVLLRQQFASDAAEVRPFRASHDSSWWTGDQATIGTLVPYPSEVQDSPAFNETDNDSYAVRASGQILLDEAGQYRFTDGVSEFSYLEIGGDVLIDDNVATNLFHTDTNGPNGETLGAPIPPKIVAAADVGWQDFEFIMAAGVGTDAGIIYWDYNPAAAEGARLGGGVGFPNAATDAISAGDAADLAVPDSHLRYVQPECVGRDQERFMTYDPNVQEFQAHIGVADAQPAAELQPGDVNQDYQFDQRDIVALLQSASKFLTGQPATWGEGDWNGGPGGRPGEPPAGDGLFNQQDIISAMRAAKYLTGNYATIQIEAVNGYEIVEQTPEADGTVRVQLMHQNPETLPHPNGDNIAFVAEYLNEVEFEGFYAIFPRDDDFATPSVGGDLDADAGRRDCWDRSNHLNLDTCEQRIDELDRTAYWGRATVNPRRGGVRNDNQTSIGYDVETGEMFVDVPPDVMLSLIRIDSAEAIFTGKSETVFKFDAQGFASLSFGKVARAGLSEDFLLNDLTVFGSLLGNPTGIGEIDLIYVPEPSTLALLCLAFVGVSIRKSAAI